MTLPGSGKISTGALSKCFFDTNVVVYALGFDDHHKTRTAQLLFRIQFQKSTLCLSTQVLLETYNTLTRKIRQTASEVDAWAAVRALSRFHVHTVDVPTIQAAIGISQRSQISLWDALLIASAALMGATTLYTEDLNHGQVIEGIQVVNPFLAESAA